MSLRLIVPSALAAASLAASLAACATPPGDAPRQAGELERLSAECRERGGILTPIPGANTGRPQADFACEIRGGASRLTRN